MYRYDEFDATLVAERVEQFRGQVARRLSGADRLGGELSHHVAVPEHVTGHAGFEHGLAARPRHVRRDIVLEEQFWDYPGLDLRRGRWD